MIVSRRAGSSLARRGRSATRPVSAWRYSDAGAAAAESREGDAYVMFALRWWWLILACLALGLGGAYAYYKRGPVPYQSTALVLVPQQADTDRGGQTSASNVKGTAQNYAAQAASQRVFDLVSKAIAGKLPAGRQLSTRDLLLLARDHQIDIRQQRGSNVVSIAVTDTMPRVARLLADTIAGVFVDDINATSKADVESHQAQLQGEIELTRQRLITSQLRQREQDLSDKLRDQRTQLLQVQLQYQQEVQRQVEIDRITAEAGRSQPSGSPTLAGAQNVAQLQQRLQEIAASSTGARGERLQQLQGQQQQYEAAIDDLTAQLSDVRAQLAQLGGTVSSGDSSAGTPAAAATPVAADTSAAQREVERVRQLQTQRSQLVGRADALSKQLLELSQQRGQLQVQYQQEVQRQVEAQRQALVPEPAPRPAQPSGNRPAATAVPAPTMTAAQQRELADLAARANQAGAQQLQAIKQQQDDLDKAIAGLNAELTDVRARLAQLPADAELARAADQAATGAAQAAAAAEQAARRRADEAQAQQREQQAAQQAAQALRDQRAVYQQREQSLLKGLDDQRSQLRQVQLLVAQELDRRLQDERQTVQMQAQLQAQLQPPSAGGAQPPVPLTAAQQERLQALADASAAVRLRWLQTTSDQQHEVEHNIAELDQQLADVRSTIAARPDNSDPMLDAAFASAYKDRLQSLTAEFVRGQINSQSAMTTLVRYGDASVALPMLNPKKLAAMGGGGGLVAGVGLSYAADLLLRLRRAQRLRRAAVPVSQRAPAMLLVTALARRRAGAPNGETPGDDSSTTGGELVLRPAVTTNGQVGAGEQPGEAAVGA